RGVLDQSFGKHMVVISSLAKQFARQLAQMAFGAAGAFALKFSFQTKDPTFLLFPMTLSQEVTRRSNCWTRLPKIDAHHSVMRFDLWRGNADHHMQPEAPFSVTQISTTHLVANVLLCVPIRHHCKLHASGNGGQAGNHVVPVDPIRS